METLHVDSIGLLITIIVQVIAIVWAAAKLHSAVKALDKTVDHLSHTLDDISDRVQRNSIDIEVLRSKVGDR